MRSHCRLQNKKQRQRELSQQEAKQECLMLFFVIVLGSKVLAPNLRRNWTYGHVRPLLELGRLHGNGDADKENAEHRKGGVATPVLGPAVRPTRHAPYFGSEIAASFSSSSSHFLLRLDPVITVHYFFLSGDDIRRRIGNDEEGI